MTLSNPDTSSRPHDGQLVYSESSHFGRQVKDLKTIIRIIPLLTTGIFLFTPIAIQTSLIVLQALAMDLHLAPHFQIPVGSMLVFLMLSTSIFLTLVDRVPIPMFQKLTGIHPTPLQRIGIGHVLVILSMAISSLLESKRLSIVHAHDLDGNSVVPMSAFWIAPQLVILGIAEAFYQPGQVSILSRVSKSTKEHIIRIGFDACWDCLSFGHCGGWFY
nr:protein NRT1/ PTR FAMILY 2.7-like [Tanacetum cinerariifolium]GFA37032.1 protein NRT1/ PTR FAMILY 2.7-like [Tanacetum cinerariifolium]